MNTEYVEGYPIIKIDGNSSSSTDQNQIPFSTSLIIFHLCL